MVFNLNESWIHSETSLGRTVRALPERTEREGIPPEQATFSNRGPDIKNSERKVFAFFPVPLYYLLVSIPPQLLILCLDFFFLASEPNYIGLTTLTEDLWLTKSFPSSRLHPAWWTAQLLSFVTLHCEESLLCTIQYTSCLTI